MLGPSDYSTSICTSEQRKQTDQRETGKILTKLHSALPHTQTDNAKGKMRSYQHRPNWPYVTKISEMGRVVAFLGFYDYFNTDNKACGSKEQQNKSVG